MTVPLTGVQWAISIGLGASMLIVGSIIRYIPAPEWNWLKYKRATSKVADSGEYVQEAASWKAKEQSNVQEIAKIKSSEDTTMFVKRKDTFLEKNNSKILHQ